MAYGGYKRGGYFRRGKGRGVYAGSGNPGNGAVKRTMARTQRKQAKKKSTASEKSLVNKMAIMTLSKQVNNLQRSKLGDFQSCFWRMGFQPTWLQGDELPICFCVNDFNDGYVANVGAPVYRGNLPASYTKIGNFQKLTNFPKPDDAIDYFYKSEDNTASRIVYAPISTNFQIQIKKNMATGDEPIWMRVDIVKQKKIVHNFVRTLQLPNSIVGLGKLAIENASTRNRYNKEFFQVLQTKYVRLNNRDSALKEVRGQANFYLKFNPKIPIRTDSEADGSTNTENDFYQNVDPKQMIWAIVSFSTPALEGVDINIWKTNRWYDQHGTD